MHHQFVEIQIRWLRSLGSVCTWCTSFSVSSVPPLSWCPASTRPAARRSPKDPTHVFFLNFASSPFLIFLTLLLLLRHIPKRDAPCLDGNEAESNGMNTKHLKTGLFRFAFCSTIKDAFLVFCDSTRRGGFCQALFVAPKELR